MRATLSAPVSVEVDGPALDGETISGVGAFGDRSGLRYHMDQPGVLTIESWKMFEDAPTTAGTTNFQLEMDALSLELIGSKSLAQTEQGWIIAPGQAAFSVGAQSQDIGYSVYATNATLIDIVSIPGGVDDCPAGETQCLSVSAFGIEYVDDQDNSWFLDIASSTWTLP